MAVKVEIINNPYIQRMQILIDGEPISAYSTLEKFMNDSFLHWCDKILNAIYEECNGSDFCLYFQSRKEEQKIMSVLARNDPHCTQYVSLPLDRNDSLTQRMAGLHKLIKDNQLIVYKKEYRKALIVVPEGLGKLEEELKDMEVKNIYCHIESQVIRYCDYIIRKPSGDVTILITKEKSSNQCIERMKLQNGFAIHLCDHNRFVEKIKGVFCYNTEEVHFFDTLFECLLLGTLMEVFCNCARMLSMNINEEYVDQLEFLTSTSIKIIPETEKTTLEVGRSASIKFRADMEGYSLDKENFVFKYSQTGIIRCNGMLVEGLREGKCTLYVYRKGEQLPCTQVDYNVIRRNRITQIQLETRFVEIGVGEKYKLEYTYLPNNADNVKTVVFESDDLSVAIADRYGNLRGIATGTCTVRCIAEQVCDSCKVVVKPHLKKIIANTEKLIMKYGESVEISYRTEPENCIDDSIFISSMNMQIVNVINKTVKAVGEGETKIILQNRENTVRLDIPVQVLYPQKREQEKKKGLFKRLFG